MSEFQQYASNWLGLRLKIHRGFNKTYNVEEKAYQLYRIISEKLALLNETKRGLLEIFYLVVFFGDISFSVNFSDFGWTFTMTENNTAYYTMGIAHIINRQPSISDHH